MNVLRPISVAFEHRIFRLLLSITVGLHRSTGS